MCGIVIFLDPSGGKIYWPDFYSAIKELSEENRLRGPDHNWVENFAVEGEDENRKVNLTFFSSVLHLRGGEVTQQPHVAKGEDGEVEHLLCWNGEIFEGMEIQPHENDGSKFFKAIVTAEDDRIFEALGEIEGPYAFVYYRKSTRKIYFGRDPLGRRSLLIHPPTPSQPQFILTSTCTNLDSPFKFDEVSAESVFEVKLDDINSIGTLDRQPSRSADKIDYVRIEPLCSAIPRDNLPVAEWDSPSDAILSSMDEFITTLDASVKLRVQDIPHYKASGLGAARVGVLFSGGIDCTVLTFLADRHLPLDEPIDLLNVAFENPRMLNARTQPPRVKNIKKKGQIPKEVNQTSTNEASHLSSLIETRLDIYDVPDRITGKEQLEELRRVCPNRTWNFVEVNVTYEESQKYRRRIEELMYPSRTVMDLSLASALYFASRGTGVIRDPLSGEGADYQSAARVLLSGLGSDELLGGYARHRNAFTKSSWLGLIEELQLDLTRLPTRNLGRDDRVISSHGKETRYPFLALPFVSFVARLPVEVKVDPRLGEGKGDKMLLRLATRKLGLVAAATRRKRAMQFGSRSARMEGGDGDRKGNVLL